MSEWQTVNIAEICLEIIDCVNRTAPTVDYLTPYKMIRTTNVRNGWIDTDTVRYVTEETYMRWARRGELQRGDVILTREAPLGEVGIIRHDDTIFMGQRLMMYRADPTQLDAFFLLYAMQEQYLQGQIRAYGSGSTVEHMRVPDAKKLNVLLPPLETQHRIAAILSAYDDLIENNTRRIQALEQAAHDLYREWFVEFRFPGHESVPLVDSGTDYGMIPQGWEVVRLTDCCNLVMGQSPKSELYNEEGVGLPFHQGVGTFGERFPVTKRWTTADGRIANTGDILFSVRAPVGRMNVADAQLILGRGLSAIRSKRDCQTFIFEQLKIIFHEEDLIGGGTIFQSVTKADMENIQLIQPDLSVMMAFEAIAHPISEEIRVLSEKNNALREARDLLLPRLVSGELSVDDVETMYNDEKGV